MWASGLHGEVDSLRLGRFPLLIRPSSQRADVTILRITLPYVDSWQRSLKKDRNEIV